MLALGRCAVAIVVASFAGAACGGGERQSTRAAPRASTAAPVRAAVAPPRPRILVRKRTVTFVDRRRSVRRRDGRAVARRLVTSVRYPEVVGGTRAQRSRRFPLVVFAHGYALLPRQYRTLLHRWARAGYVVAAPVLPGENANAPGGPDRADLLNQPADMRFVISRLLAAASRRRSRLDRVIDRSRIAVAGHSDGGDTALAVAYDPRFRSRRVDAAVILAGADLAGLAPFRFPPRGPPLLAAQGGADAVNPPAATRAFYRRASPLKLLLTFPGAGHNGPYMSQRPQLDVLARVSTAFLDRTLKDEPISIDRLKRLGRRPGVSRLQAARAR